MRCHNLFCPYCGKLVEDERSECCGEVHNQECGEIEGELCPDCAEKADAEKREWQQYFEGSEESRKEVQRKWMEKFAQKEGDK